MKAMLQDSLTWKMWARSILYCQHAYTAPHACNQRKPCQKMVSQKMVSLVAQRTNKYNSKQLKRQYNRSSLHIYNFMILSLFTTKVWGKPRKITLNYELHILISWALVLSFTIWELRHQSKFQMSIQCILFHHGHCQAG